MNGFSSCAACPHNDVGFCGALLRNVESTGSSKASDWQHHFVVRANRQVLGANQVSPDVYVLCTGWAFRFLQLPNGRKQILSFLLAGDLFSAGSLFQDRQHFSVKALTAVQVCGRGRTEVLARVTSNPNAAMAVAKSCTADTEALETMNAALGQCSADERIAYLFLHLMQRIAVRSVIRDHRYPLPLRQQHIAEAVGLTPVHVSRVLGAFRARGIADLSNGVLEVSNMRALERLGRLS